MRIGPERPWALCLLPQGMVLYSASSAVNIDLHTPTERSA